MASSSAAGVSRRSHTKSRKGCKTCKKRHIRCDETFPQCRNCVKHQVRCDYMDIAPAENPQSDDPSPELYWTPEVEAVIDYWQRTGKCNLGSFTIDLGASGYRFSKSDLHLIYHALWSGSYSLSNEFTLWTSKTPKFLDVASSTPYLVHAILGFGSLAVAWEKKSADAKTLAYQHGGMALQGLQEAIGVFSKENADAVLAASIILSWQANDWRSWASLVAGIRTVVNSMQTWKSESKLADVVEEYEFAIPEDFSTSAGAPSREDPLHERSYVLQQLHSSMDRFLQYLEGRTDAVWIEQLKNYIQRLLNVGPAKTLEEQFNHLYAFRKWLFWVPATLLRSESRDYMTLVVLSFFYATALALEPLYPDVAPAFCSAITLSPLEEIFCAFDELRSTSAYPNHELQTLFGLMEWPRQIASSYRAHMRQRGAREPQSSLATGFAVFSSGLEQAVEENQLGDHHSPDFEPSPSSRASAELASSQPSPYLEVPPLAQNYQASQRNYQAAPVVVPNMASGFDAEDPYGSRAHVNLSGKR